MYQRAEILGQVSYVVERLLNIRLAKRELDFSANMMTPPLGIDSFILGNSSGV
jgi:hypothetical protein